MKQDCSIKGCNNKLIARGWCSKHYQRWRVHGDVQRLPYQSVKQVCSIEECDNEVRAREWCSTHYYKWRNHGDPLYKYVPVRTTGPGTECVFMGCTSEIHKRHFCKRHYGWVTYNIGHLHGKTCAVDGCDKPHRCQGWCGTHYQRWLKYGDAERPRYQALSLEDFMNKRIDKSNDCWEWLSSKTKCGYGRLQMGPTKIDARYPWRTDLEALGFDAKQYVRAHRVAYALWVKAPINAGSVIHHSCHNRGCVNPNHLQEVSQFENAAEMLDRQAMLKEIRQLKKHIRDLEKDAT